MIWRILFFQIFKCITQMQGSLVCFWNISFHLWLVWSWHMKPFILIGDFRGVSVSIVAQEFSKVISECSAIIASLLKLQLSPPTSSNCTNLPTSQEGLALFWVKCPFVIIILSMGMKRTGFIFLYKVYSHQNYSFFKTLMITLTYLYSAQFRIANASLPTDVSWKPLFKLYLPGTIDHLHYIQVHICTISALLSIPLS